MYIYIYVSFDIGVICTALGKKRPRCLSIMMDFEIQILITLVVCFTLHGVATNHQPKASGLEHGYDSIMANNGCSKRKLATNLQLIGVPK